MTSKDKTAVANVVRKFPVVSKELESSTANELSDGQVLIKTASGVRITTCWVKFEKCCTIFGYLALVQIMKGNKINGYRLAS